MTEKHNTTLIEAICSHVPPHENSATFLADTLNMGREAAYRRLRGEVLFTYGEAAVLSERLDFSLDEIKGPTDSNVLFKLKITDFHDPLELYVRLLERDIHFFGETGADSAREFAVASNSLPAELYLRYEHLTKFKLFKWCSQHGSVGRAVQTYEQMELPARMKRMAREYIVGSESAAVTHYMFDDNVFSHWITAVRTFREMQLISPENVEVIRSELFELLDEMEEIAVSGKFHNGNKISFYLSDIDLEAAYSYVITLRHKAVGIGIFSLNALRTTDERMFNYVKGWVRNQRRFATLISGSGELCRIRYFKQQREAVGALV